MNKIFQLMVNDLRIVFRDKTLLFILCYPIMGLLFLRFGVPYINQFYPLQEWYIVLLAATCTTTGLLPAFVFSFIFLDEKDEDVLTAIRVLPISASTFLSYRLFAVFVAAFLSSLVFIKASALLQFTWGFSILVSIAFALLAILGVLFIVTFANNKIEGMTLVKAFNFVIMLPLIVFFKNGAWTNLLGILPPYWSYQAFAETNITPNFWFNFSIGLLFSTLLIFVLYKLFRAKVF